MLAVVAKKSGVKDLGFAAELQFVRHWLNSATILARQLHCFNVYIREEWPSFVSSFDGAGILRSFYQARSLLDKVAQWS